jgi:TrmH family RNA methyltransferase
VDGIIPALLSPSCAATWSPKVLRIGQQAYFALTTHEKINIAGLIAE